MAARTRHGARGTGHGGIDDVIAVREDSLHSAATISAARVTVLLRLVSGLLAALGKTRHDQRESLLECVHFAE
ncbi:hypothetical protein [Streptomyces sp. MS1.AVA.4]|uniref:Uncharacterized protein n=1 Tax=Streptomyces pratisoli TaxID=3139917 RepID=A0ACC6QPC7_9ACTN